MLVVERKGARQLLSRAGRRIALTVVSAAALFGAARADAAVLVADNFDNVATGAHINGRTPSTTTDSRTWIAGTNTYYGTSGGGVTGNSASASVAVVDIGAGYLSNNPGVYSVSANLTQPTGITASSWIALGFSQGAAGAGNFVDNKGGPWTLFRLNGQQIVFGGPQNASDAGNTTNVYQSATDAVSRGVSHLFRLDLDTSTAAWTLNAYLDNVQLDLNGGSAGNTFTYAVNPTSIRYAGFSTGNNGDGGTGTFDNFQLSGPVPEPGVGLLAVGAMGLLAARRRRCESIDRT